VWLTASAALVAHAARADDAVRSYLDQTTAATITVAVQTFVFARERTDLAVNARDYISLVPIEVNRSGQRAYYWFGYAWSTIDRRDQNPIVTASDELVLVADGRPIRLQRATTPSRELGLATPPTPSPARAAVAVLCPTDAEILNYVGAAAELHVQLIRDGQGEDFLPWRDARAALNAFVSTLGLAAQ
jgi:hypothetical protein